ncbi:MAG: S-layer family protein, partial [Cyanobacteria bacterium P01_A01_bin.80]
FDGQGSGKSTGAFSQVNSKGEGNAGGVQINTGSLSVLNGARISSSTRGKGDAGSVEISAKTFEANNGSTIASRTSTEFPAGNIILNVTDDITLTGSDTGIFANTTEGSTGKGGSIIIDPKIMTVKDGAAISVNSEGEGIGGDIELAAGFLTLDNGTISAQTRSNTGGNITLNLQDVLLLRNNSQISSTAGNQQFGGDGGNISINSPFIVALPNENSDITANAFEGRGGNIDIITQGLFGIESRPQTTLQSDITASSETGIQGEISVTDPEIDPSQGLLELPSGVVDKSDQIAQICPRGVNAKKLSEFYITGRGSLPPSPLDMLTGTVELSRLATLDGEIRNEKVGFLERKEQESKKIIEAQGFMKTENGEIYLVAQAPTVTPTSQNTASACLSSK